MIITTSQKTTTVFSIAMDAADVKDLLVTALRGKLSVREGEGVTVAVELVAGADGAIGGTASIAVETTDAPQADAADDKPATPPVGPPVVAPVKAAPLNVAPVEASPIADAPPTPGFVPGFIKAA